MWLDEDPLVDRTVHVPFLVRVRHSDGSEAEAYASYVLLDRDTLVYQDVRQPRGVRIALAGIAAGDVEIRPLPSDWELLRAAYSAAYSLWREDDLRVILRWARAGEPSAEEMARRLHRPPEHIRTKADRLMALARDVIRSPRDEPAPYHEAPDRIPGRYIVSVGEQAHPADVAMRAGVVPAALFLSVVNGFAADLTDQQREALRRDPDVEMVSDDAPPSLRSR
jgi:hypothetical protein